MRASWFALGAVVVVACSSGNLAGNGTGEAGGGGKAGGNGSGGTGGTCPTEVPPYDLPFGGMNPYASCCPQSGDMGAGRCATTNLLCWGVGEVQCPFSGYMTAATQFRCDGTTFARTGLYDYPGCGPVGTGGGGTTGTGGAGGQAGGGGAGGLSYIGPPRSPDPWPASCVTGPLERPAGPKYLTGPYSVGGGRPALPGESVVAKLNDLDRSFTTDLIIQRTADSTGSWITIQAVGSDGRLYLAVPDSGPGTYACGGTGASLTYFNTGVGVEGSNFSAACCRVEVTKAGAAGEMIEGTFSGILNENQYATSTWIDLEEGSFKLVLRGAGGIGF